MSVDEPLILVVDDNEMNRDMLSRRLERQGYRSLLAEDGVQAVELLAAHRFDLVLLDIMMPRLNGYQVLEHIKQDAVLRHIPVIMISAVDDLDSVVKCVEMGAEDYLFKPFNPILLKARINASLEKKRLRDRERHFLAASALPPAVAERVQRGETVAEMFAEVTALVARVSGLDDLTPDEAAHRLDEALAACHTLAAQHAVYGVEIPGGVYLAVSGVPEARADHAAVTAALAHAMLQTIHAQPGLALHIGVHTGAVVGAVIGSGGAPHYAVWGEAVTVADRLSLAASAGTIQMSPAASEQLD